MLLSGVIGCHKQSATSGVPKTLDDGVAQLQAALNGANQETRSNFFSGVLYNIRYDNYKQASAALQQIAADPSLNDQQKKLASEVGDLLKQQQQNAAQPAH